MKIEVLKAGSTLSGAGDARFAKAALELALDPDKGVRETVAYVYENGQRGVLNINTPAQPDPGLVRTVSEILDHGDRTAQDTVLPLLAALQLVLPGLRSQRWWRRCGSCLSKRPGRQIMPKR